VQCPERARLFDHFERTARVFAEAVSGLRDLKGFDLIAKKKLVAHTRDACDAAQAALCDHEQAHSCAGAASPESRSEELTFRR